MYITWGRLIHCRGLLNISLRGHFSHGGPLLEALPYAAASCRYVSFTFYLLLLLITLLVVSSFVCVCKYKIVFKKKKFNKNKNLCT